ncbi:hypothetical protein ACHAPA_006657 [Fusarium lateritium]
MPGLQAQGAYAEALAGSDSNVICTSRLGPKSVLSNKVPRATITIFPKMTMIKKAIRKIDVVVVSWARTSTSTSTVGKTTTTRAGLVLTKLPSGSLVRIAQARFPYDKY